MSVNLSENITSITEIMTYKFTMYLLGIYLFFNWDSLHARLNSHYEASSYKKNKYKKIKAYRKSV